MMSLKKANDNSSLLNSVNAPRNDDDEVILQNEKNRNSDLEEKKKTFSRSLFLLDKMEESMLRDGVANILQQGKGILAADEPIEVMSRRFSNIDVENNAENRRRYRQLLFTTPNIAKHISAVILHPETYEQYSDRGERMADFLRRQGIAVGVTIDSGTVPLIPPAATGGIGLDSANAETLTLGCFDIEQRAAKYRAGGCAFVKWRSEYRISNGTPSKLAVEQNAMILARCAMVCQRHCLVPIIEPDVSCEGEHTIEQCQQATQCVLAHLVKTLADHNIFLEGILIKMNMVTPGLGSSVWNTPEQIAEQTLLTLSRRLPAAIPGITFLSGGQTDVIATQNLCAINKFAGPTGTSTKPWQLTFCFGRALQAHVMEIWRGNSENVGAAQKQFLLRARACSDAEKGEYEDEKSVAKALAGVSFNGQSTRYY